MQDASIRLVLRFPEHQDSNLNDANISSGTSETVNGMQECKSQSAENYPYTNYSCNL